MTDAEKDLKDGIGHKILGGVEIFIAVMPNGRAFVPFTVEGQGVAFPFDSLPEVIAHLQELQVAGPPIIEKFREAILMGEPEGSVN